MGTVDAPFVAQTPVGALPVVLAAPVGGAVTIIIRPENIRADGTGRLSLGAARITEAIFQGAHYRVLAQAETSGQAFVLRLPPSAAPVPGHLLSLSCQEDDLVAV
jgi:hypothetical protein